MEDKDIYIYVYIIDSNSLVSFSFIISLNASPGVHSSRANNISY